MYSAGIGNTTTVKLTRCLPDCAEHWWLLQVCQYEQQLFDHFFPGEDAEGPSLGPLMDPLATILYDALRPRFIHLHALEQLCDIVDILAHEVTCLEGSTAHNCQLVQILKHVYHDSEQMPIDMNIHMCAAQGSGLSWLWH